MSVYNTKTIKTGYYTVINTDKITNKNKVLFYRSGLEKKFMRICDHSKNILKWSYEEVVIPYKKLYQTDNKIHRYIMDFWIKKTVGKKIKQYLVEIKPYDFLSPPKPQKRRTRKYVELVENYSTNVAKWDQANKYCIQKGWDFAIITEKDLD